MRGNEKPQNNQNAENAEMKSRKNYENIKRGIMLLNFTIIFIVLLIVNLYFSLPFKAMIYAGEEYVYSMALPFGSETAKEQKINLTSEQSVANISFQKAIKVSTSQPGDYQLNVKALGAIPLKTMEISVLPKNSVIPLGTSVGVKIATNGALVINLSNVKATDGKSYSPAKDSGLKNGDLIVAINDEPVRNADDLSTLVEKSNGEKLNVKVKRENQEHTISIQPFMEQDTNLYKLGIWVRDGSTGIGTMTFYDPSTQKFAALGHGIADQDTGKILHVGNGSIIPANVVSVRKGERGNPGELKGYLKEDVPAIGEIQINNKFGVFGKLNKASVQGKEAIPSASRDEVTTGEAYILSNIKGQSVERYQIQIEKVFKNATDTNKGMIIKVTDQKLLETTGGIVQGMSGSPIIQNDRIVGAVTHVFVNDPERGYGTFIDTMLEQMNNVS